MTKGTIDNTTEILDLDESKAKSLDSCEVQSTEHRRQSHLSQKQVRYTKIKGRGGGEMREVMMRKRLLFDEVEIRLCMRVDPFLPILKQI